MGKGRERPERKHYDKQTFISELFEEDRKAWLVLPSKEYQCVRYETLKADKYGYIKVEKNSTQPRRDLLKEGSN